MSYWSLQGLLDIPLKKPNHAKDKPQGPQIDLAQSLTYLKLQMHKTCVTEE